MLYTAMREYPCYGGYLWAPFDTLLNVPRLQQFDQRYFWYHSPFGQYVPNPVLGVPWPATNRTVEMDDGEANPAFGDEEGIEVGAGGGKAMSEEERQRVRERRLHAPPANISPDPSINLTATWKHWGPDWW